MNAIDLGIRAWTRPPNKQPMKTGHKAPDLKPLSPLDASRGAVGTIAGHLEACQTMSGLPDHFWRRLIGQLGKYNLPQSPNPSQ